MRKKSSILFSSTIFFIVMILFFLLSIGIFDFQKERNSTQPLKPFPEINTSKEYRNNDAGTIAHATVPSSSLQQNWYRNQVVVLMYHHIKEQPESRYSISPVRFREHMQFLKDNGFHPITLREFLRFVDTGLLETENAVLITFDDGYESYYTEAFPVLKEFEFPSVNFVIAGRLRDTRERTRENMIPPLTYPQVLEMIQSGLVEIGSHTYSLHERKTQNEWGDTQPLTAPVYLEDLNRVEREPEYRNRLYVDFSMSRAALEELTAKPVEVISFPFGFTNAIVSETAREAGFSYCFTSEPKVVKPGVSPLAIPRMDVGHEEISVARLHRMFQQAAKNS